MSTISKKITLMSSWGEKINPKNLLPEYPRPQFVRKDWINLNGYWQCELSDSIEKKPDIFSKKILVPFAVESFLSGIEEKTDYIWYKKAFSIPKNWESQNIILHFGAVDWYCEAYINGIFVGKHKGGYNAFSLDITEQINWNEENELTLAVFDPDDKGNQPRGKQVKDPFTIWYTPVTGIWQTVWLEPVPLCSIEKIKLTPNIDNNQIHIDYSLKGNNNNYKLFFRIYSEKKLIKEIHTKAKTQDSIKVELNSAILWSPDKPFLYDLEIIIADENNFTIDFILSYFAMRKIEVNKDNNGITRILLNNEFVFQKGLLDQGYWPDGLYTAPSDEALKFDIEKSKEMGFNLLRKHVKTEPDRWYYWCDKLGMLVWQDMPSGDYFTDEGKKYFAEEMIEMMNNLHNHPSIVAWVVFNEGWGQFSTKEMTKLATVTDPSRIINSVSGWNDEGVGDIIDVHCYPGPGWIEPEDKRAAVMGEFGGPRLYIDHHSWIKNDKNNWGYFNLENSEVLTQNYENVMTDFYEKVENPGLSAIIYTQLTDVEIECNGLISYDRKVIKVDIDRIKIANNGTKKSGGKIQILLPTSHQKPGEWLTKNSKVANWNTIEFDDKNWKKQLGGFGNTKHGRPFQSYINSLWDQEELYLRKSFILDEDNNASFYCLIHNQCDFELFINGHSIDTRKNAVPYMRLYYWELPIAPNILRQGENIIAVKCKKTNDKPFFDMGMIYKIKEL